MPVPPWRTERDAFQNSIGKLPEIITHFQQTFSIINYDAKSTEKSHPMTQIYFTPRNNRKYQNISSASPLKPENDPLPEFPKRICTREAQSTQARSAGSG
jgi:hypothetical protein